jgi:thymidylate synthase (FAD)
MSVKLVAVTTGRGDLEGRSAEEIIVYAARVSNPENQANFETGEKLLAYCLREKHFSVFETASMTVEIKTSRAIAEQILRHKSFTAQVFSQRYAKATRATVNEARRQDSKNRQNSVDDLPQETKDFFLEAQKSVWDNGYALYMRALELGIAKESARFLLPLSTETTLYLTGNFRTIFHYVELRCSHGTQLEHQRIAEGIKDIVVRQFPKLAAAFKWTSTSQPSVQDSEQPSVSQEEPSAQEPSP